MMDWQPIETAPRDGKSFLAYYGMSDDSVPHPIVLVVSWSAYVSEFEPDYFIGDDLENRPISWQPLPAPPSPPADATTAPEVEGMTTKTGDGHDTAKYTSTAVLGRVTYISNTAARATAAPDDNALPTDLLPEGVGFSSLIALKEGYGVDLYSLSRKVASQVFSGTGPTPRAAMLAAIKAAGRTEE